MRGSVAILFALALVLAAPVRAEQAIAPVRGASVEGVREFRLANGLRVLLAPDESKPTTTVNVTYLVGSRMEKYGETGMAHLLEHLMFKGSPDYPGNSIVQEFAKRGMRFNGSTWYDRTNYYETFTAGSDNLDWTLGMEANRMVHSNIARADLDSEMTVVRNEMEQGENNPARILREKMTAAAFQWHNYGKSAIGARSDVENVDIAHLQAFYRTYYQPDNAVLMVTGKFDPDQTLQRIGRTFGAIARPERVLPLLWTVEPVQDGARAVSLSRVGDIQIVGALYHIPQAASGDFAALEVWSEILGDTPNGRLYQALVEKKLAATVSAAAMPLRDPGFVLLFATLEKSQNRDKAAKAMLDVAETVRKSPVTEGEVKRAQVALVNGIEKTIDDPAQFGVGLSEAIAVGDWRLFFLDRDRIKAVTVADVQHVAETYFKDSNRTFGDYVPTPAPDRAAMPAPVEIDKLVAAYQGNKALPAGESFDPSPANIEQRTRRTRLKSGLQLAELVKKNRGETVAGTLVINLGDVDSLKGKKTLARTVAQMLNRGAGALSHKDIANRLEQLKTTLSVQAYVDHVTLTFETKRDQLGDLLDLIGDLVRHPTFPEAELLQLKTESLTVIEARRQQPEAIAQNALARADNPYPKGDVRYAESWDEQIDAIKAVTVADLKAFHDAFYGADHAQLALVGDFDAGAVEPQVTRLFGTWQATKPYRRVPVPYRVTPSASQQLEAPDKANAYYLAGLSMRLQDDDPAAVPLLLGDRILGSAGLKSRIADRLRQRDGISYGAGSNLWTNPFEPNSYLTLFAIYAPQNLPRLKADIGQLLATLLQDGVTPEELTEAKSGLLQSWTVGRTQDRSLAAQFASQMKIGRTMAFEAEREAKVQSTSVDQVNQALRTYVTLDHLVQIFAGDFAAVENKTSERR